MNASPSVRFEDSGDAVWPVGVFTFFGVVDFVCGLVGGFLFVLDSTNPPSSDMPRGGAVSRAPELKDGVLDNLLSSVFVVRGSGGH